MLLKIKDGDKITITPRYEMMDTERGAIIGYGVLKKTLSIPGAKTDFIRAACVTTEYDQTILNIDADVERLCATAVSSITNIEPENKNHSHDTEALQITNDGSTITTTNWEMNETFNGLSGYTTVIIYGLSPKVHHIPGVGINDLMKNSRTERNGESILALNVQTVTDKAALDAERALLLLQNPHLGLQ